MKSVRTSCLPWNWSKHSETSVNLNLRWNHVTTHRHNLRIWLLLFVMLAQLRCCIRPTNSCGRVHVTWRSRWQRLIDQYGHLNVCHHVVLWLWSLLIEPLSMSRDVRTTKRWWHHVTCSASVCAFPFFDVSSVTQSLDTPPANVVLSRDRPVNGVSWEDEEEQEEEEMVVRENVVFFN